MADRMIYFNSNRVGIPANALDLDPTRMIFFKWIPSIEPCNFEILVEDLSGDWKSLGKLRTFVKLPPIFYSPYAKLVVRGTNKDGIQVRYLGQLNVGQGTTYSLIRDDSDGTTIHIMPSSVSSTCCRSAIPG
ncbi:hypothetical protein C8_275 [Cannes 8 virus]|uniref:hypothetical protein n=1 Tax=Melbournevirus TaxID=1560514 RepID=UPI000392B406|nr:hypothetical protein MEL_234 [Melbournevirus]AGV01624.1 hypothetical protein C8_275 [Cannes 8 virus]AIT54847.1 hypothetical protein MEL_234 [Melbournevirus]